MYKYVSLFALVYSSYHLGIWFVLFIVISECNIKLVSTVGRQFIRGNYRTTRNLQPIWTFLIACLIDVLHDFPFARPDNYIGLYDLNVLH